jgi:hypothetical protein
MDHSRLDDADTLTGWKEIAAYLGRSARTAQRWETELGLPVQRSVDPDGTPALRASRQAVDAWRERQTALASRDASSAEPDPTTSSDSASETSSDTTSKPDSPPGPLGDAEAAPDQGTQHRSWATRWIAVLVSIFIAGGAIGSALAVTMIPATRTPTRFEVVGTEIKALTESDATVWTYPLGATGRRPEDMSSSQPEQGDVDGDGTPEIAVSVTFARPEMWATESDTVLLFDRDGRLRWRVQPHLGPGDDVVLKGPWRLASVAFSSAPPGLVWIAFNHDQPGRPSLVLEVTPDGRQSVRYMQAGRIHAITHWRAVSGNYIAVGGTDEATSLASVVLVAPDQGAARWPLGSEGPACRDCPRDSPAAAYVFPMSELNRIFSRPRGLVYRLLVIDGRLRVETRDGPRRALLAWVDPDLRVRDTQRPLSYWTTHEGLRAEGRVDHTIDACPDRRTPTSIRAWRAGAGWTDDPVTAPMSSR